MFPRILILTLLTCFVHYDMPLQRIVDFYAAIK